MDIGRSAPRYQAMALLYPHSKSLQSQLLEYFIVVVGLCQYFFNFTGKPTVRQFISGLNDSVLKTFQADLERWASSIKEEVALIEAQENSRFRALSDMFSKSANHQQRIATNLRVLDFCSKFDHERTWKRTRKIGNTAVFASLAEYQDWKDSSSSCTLLYTGKLGSGKSVLLANIVDDLNIHARNNASIVAYFFCRHEMSESLKARTILGSLARQLLRTIPDLATVAGGFEETHTTQNTEKLLKLIFRGIPSSRKAYFVLDGLDECEPAEREVVAQGLKRIQSALNLRLLISFRLEPSNGLDPITKELKVTHAATIPEENPDIETFIETQLGYCLESQRLILGDPAIILNIQDALLAGSQGMFLWVALQIQTLCELGTDQAIKDALSDLPKDLPETFSRILHKSARSGRSYQKRILQLVAAAFRPLKADELREALSVVPGDTVWTPSRILNNVRSALASCGCLLTVDEEETTVHFVHHSVKQFLLADSNDSNNLAFSVEEAQRTMADIIVTYLSYGVFGTEISKTRVRPVMVQSAPSRIVRTATASSSTIQAVALRLLKSRKQPAFDMSNVLAEARKSFQSKMEDFCFYSYGEAYWLHHIIHVSGQLKAIQNLSVKLINRWTQQSDVEPIGIDVTVFDWATKNGNEAIFQLLAASDKVKFYGTHQQMHPVLMWAVKNGLELIVKSLLNTGRVDINLKDDLGRTPLALAVEFSQESILKLLFSIDEVDVNSKDGIGKTALSWAACYGQEVVAKLILGTAKVDPDSKDNTGRTPLSWAAARGSDAVVELLLGTNAVDPDSKDNNGMTPLSYAAQNGWQKIIKLLLGTGKVDTEAEDNLGKTPRQWAISLEYEAAATPMGGWGELQR